MVVNLLFDTTNNTFKGLLVVQMLLGSFLASLVESFTFQVMCYLLE